MAKHVVTLVVIRHIIEQKYERSTKEGRYPFIDAWVYSETERLMLLRSLPELVAHLVHHIVNVPDQAQGLIEDLYTSIGMRMKVHLVIEAESLPTLSPRGSVRPSVTKAGRCPSRKHIKQR